MSLKQISVFVENQQGAAADVLHILAQNAINISALSIADTADYGIMRLIVQDPDTAKQLLSEQGITVRCTEVLAIPMNDQPGELANVLTVLKDAGVSVEYLYAFVGQRQQAVVVAKTDDIQKASDALSRHSITPLSSAELF